MEMEMELKVEDVDKDLNHVIRNINLICEKREKKIIVFELIGLAMADSKYDEEERTIINNALAVFGLESNFADYCEKKLTEYFDLQNELNTSILT